MGDTRPALFICRSDFNGTAAPVGSFGARSIGKFYMAAETGNVAYSLHRALNRRTCPKDDDDIVSLHGATCRHMSNEYCQLAGYRLDTISYLVVVDRDS